MISPAFAFSRFRSYRVWGGFETEAVAVGAWSPVAGGVVFEGAAVNVDSLFLEQPPTGNKKVAMQTAKGLQIFIFGLPERSHEHHPKHTLKFQAG